MLFDQRVNLIMKGQINSLPVLGLGLGLCNMLHINLLSLLLLDFLISSNLFKIMP